MKPWNNKDTLLNLKGTIITVNKDLTLLPRTVYQFTLPRDCRNFSKLTSIIPNVDVSIGRSKRKIIVTTTANTVIYKHANLVSVQY